MNGVEWTVQSASLQCALSRICDNNIAIILGINFRTWFAKSHVRKCWRKGASMSLWSALYEIQTKSQWHACHHPFSVACMCLTQSRKSFFIELLAVWFFFLLLYIFTCPQHPINGRKCCYKPRLGGKDASLHKPQPFSDFLCVFQSASPSPLSLGFLANGMSGMRVLISVHFTSAYFKNPYTLFNIFFIFIEYFFALILSTLFVFFYALCIY